MNALEEENEESLLSKLSSEEPLSDDDILKKAKRMHKGKAYLSSPYEDPLIENTFTYTRDRKERIPTSIKLGLKKPGKVMSIAKGRATITKEDVEKSITLATQCVCTAILLAFILSRLTLKCLFMVGRKVLTAMILPTVSESQLTKRTFYTQRMGLKGKGDTPYRQQNIIGPDPTIDEKMWTKNSEWRSELTRNVKGRKQRDDLSEDL